MSADKVRKLLGSLQDDPENEKAWISLMERTINGELAQAGPEVTRMLEESRRRFIERGEAEAADQMLDIEIELTTDRAQKIALMRQRARLLEEELLDDKAALAVIEAILAFGADPEAIESRDRLTSKKSRWKEIAAAYKRHAENDTTDPTLIASHLVSAAGILLQYKGKGQHREADTIFETALTVDPGNLRAILLYERVLRRRGGRWDDLASMLERGADAISDKVAKVAVLFRAARTHAGRRHNIADAERVYRRILEIDPGNADATRFVVAILQDRERWDDLARFYEDQLKNNSSDVGLLVQAGMTHWRMLNNPAAAAPFFAKLREVAPDHQAAASFFAEYRPHDDDEVAIDTGDEEEVEFDDELNSMATEELGAAPAWMLAEIQAASRAARQAAPAAPAAPVAPSAPAAPSTPAATRSGLVVTHTTVVLGGDSARRNERPPTGEAPAASTPAVQPEPEPAPTPVVSTPAAPVEVSLPPPVIEVSMTPAAVEVSVPPPPVDRHEEAPIRLSDKGTILSAAPVPVAPAPVPVAPAPVAEPVAPPVETPPAPPAAAAPQPAPEPVVETPKPVVSAPTPSVHRAPTPAPVPQPERPPTGTFQAAARPPAAVAPRPAAPAPANRIAAAIELAQNAEAAGQIERAIEGWKMVARQDATNTDARAALVRLYSAAGRWNNLVEMYRQELESLGGVRSADHKERKLEILREMVAIYRDRMNQEPLVAQTYNNILALEPGDRSALVALAASYEKQGRFTDVVKTLDQQAEHTEDPTEKVALLRRVASIWLERFNNVNNATRPLEQILSIDPADADAISQLKELYVKRRAWRPLFDVSRREADILEGDKKRDAVVEMARLAAEKLSSPTEAIALWREALSIDPRTPGALDALEKLTEREKDFAGLAEVLERRVEETSDPEHKVNVLMKLGAVYGERLNDPARSIDAWKRVLGARPGHPKAMRVLRDAYTQSGQWDVLEELYASAGDFEGLADVIGTAADRATEPETRIALSFRAARIYEGKLDQPERAFRSYERVLSVDPKNLEAATALVPIYLREEKWPRLAQLYEILLEALPEGDAENALGYLQKLRELAATRLGDRAGAFRWALQAYKLRPTDADLESTLEHAAADAGAWRELVATFDARAAATDDAVERRRLRDKSALIEADRLNLLDASIERYQSALASAPDDEHVIVTLDRLLRRAQRWGDLRALYDHRIERTSDAAARRALLLEVARLEESELHDADAASRRFRAILAEEPGDPEALESLSRLSEAGERWEELAGLLATRRDAADGVVRAELAYRLGELRAQKLNDTPGAIESFREVLALAPHHAGALASLEAMLRDPAWRVTAAQLLEPEFEAIREHKKLAWVLQILLDTSEDRDTRRTLALRLARIYGEELEDGRSGFELVRSELEQQPESEELADALGELATLGGWNEELANAYAKIVDREGVDPEVRVRLARRTAAVYDDRHDNPEAAERFHRVVLDAGGLDLHAFNALKRFYQERERWDDLRALYATWVERTPEAEARIELLLEEATVLEEILDQPAEAAAVYEKILKLDETNRAASRALDRLLIRLGRWDALAELLTRTITQIEDAQPDEALDLLYRRGEVREQHLGDPAGALDDFERVVQNDPNHPGARAGLERLLNVASLRQRAGSVLEPLYLSDGDRSAGDLVRMLLVRLEGTQDTSDRADLFHRVAELREIVLNDTDGAFDAIVQAVLSAPTNESMRGELLRLAEISDRNAAAADTLEKAAEDPKAASSRVALLKDLANLYDERLIDHAKAERTYRKLLEVAPDNTEVVTLSAVALERLYRGLQNARGLVEALELRARHEPDQDLCRSLYAQAGEILEDELKDLPGAVAAQRARLAIDPTDRDALSALARLYEKTAAWPDLVATLRQDAQLAGDADEQKRLLIRAAGVLENQVRDIPAAIALYSEILETYGADRALHGALARLYEVSEAWNDLLDVLDRDLLVATDAPDRLALIVRIAELRRLRTHELPRAVEGYKEALDLDPSEPTARGALAALLSSEEPGVPLAAARALDPVLQAEQAWERLVEVLDRIAADTDDPDERRQSLARAAEVCEIGMNNPGRAFDYASRELRESIDGPDLESRLGQVESLAKASNRHADLVSVLRAVAPDLGDADLQLAVFMKVAELSRYSLNDRATAREYYEKALDQRPDYVPALDALETLHEESSQYPELIAVLRRKTDLAESDEDRRALYRKQARINEENLHDRPAAAQAHESILSIGFDAEAAQALERIYAAETRWDDLAQLLESQLTIPDADAADLHYRLGVVAMNHLNDPDRALEHFREVLERLPDHANTVAALETLGQREGYAARTAAMLEPIYLARMDMPKLIGALEARIAAETDIQSRKELLNKLGTLYEENLGDLDKALDTYARVFREEISDRETWDVLSRIARQLNRWDRLADTYAQALEDTTADDDVTTELSFRTAELFDQKAGDTQRARRYYHRALAFDPTRAEVFNALEALLQRESAYQELLQLYRDAADRSGDVEERKGYLFKIASIDESALGDLPRAIEDYRTILDTDPADARAIDALDRLLVRTEAWTDLAELLERRIVDAIDSTERASLRYRLGRLRVERLGDAQGAVDSFREILDERRDHRESIAALEQIAESHPDLRLAIVEILEPLYRDLDDWQKLVHVLTVRLQAATDTVERTHLLREIGLLKDARAKDTPGAFEAYSQAFSIDPGDGEAREAIERLAVEHGLWDQLVQSYETAFAATDDVVIKTDLLRAIAQTHDGRRDDPRSAIEAYNRLYALDDSQLDVLDLLEGLHVLLSDWEGHVEVLERKVSRSMDDEQRKALLHTIGESERDMLGKPELAISAFQRALDIDPSDVVSLEALDGLYASRGDARALAGVLSQRLVIESEPEVRRQTALRLGRLWEGTDLNDASQAIDAYRRVLDDAPTDPDAIQALERLYAQQEMYPDLLENLRSQVALAADDAARVPLRLRVGQILSAQLSDLDAALETYREVLAVDPTNAEAIEAVRVLADNPDQRASAVEILEPIFRTQRRWDDLVSTLELKLTGVDDPGQRLVELRGLAEVHESGRGDTSSAFDTYRRALHEDAGDRTTLMDLERLASALGRWGDLVKLLEDESTNAGDPSVGKDLSVRAAQLAVEHLRDDARATASYRRALEQSGDDDAILEPLDRIYTRNEQWTELADVLERRASVAGDPALLDQLEVRVAELRESRFRDPAGALNAYRSVLDRTPSHPQALAGLERLIQVPEVRADALDTLEQSYQRNDDNARLAWLIELRAQGADLASDKVRLLGDLARLREERLGDVAGAFDAMVAAFGLDPRDEQVLSEIERLAPASGTWSKLQGVVEAALAAHPDLGPTEVAQLNLRAARWYHDHLGVASSAEERLTAALAADPENVDALEMLEGLHRAPGRERDLVATLRRRAELELDVDTKKRMLREAADLAAMRLADLTTAADLVTMLLDVDDADMAALDALARLRRAQGRHEDVAELLARRARLEDDPTRAVALRREVAELYAGPINDAQRAIEAYRELLDFDPNDAQARAALEAIFERSERWKDLEEALRSRLDVAASPEERASTRLRLATLAETRFHSNRDAVEYLREVIDEIPTHVEAGQQLERLYAVEQRWSDLSELLERRVDDYVAEGNVAGELAALVRIGELHERELKNTAKAIELYERVLERDPNHVGALRALARLAESEQAWERAAEMLRRALSLAPAGTEGAELALHLARIEGSRLNDLDASQRSLARAIELDPTNPQALAELKSLAQKRGDAELLAWVLEREATLSNEPKQQVALLRSLAELARDRLRDPARAAGYYERALAIVPDDREMLLPLVDLYNECGRPGDAIPILEKIIASYGTRRNKELAQWQHRLGRAYESMGDTAQALAMYDAAFKVDLTSVPILRDLGLLCLRTGDLERSQKTFRALLLQRLDASSGITKADVYYYLGETLAQQNDKPKAIGMLERAVEADKTHARAINLLAQLKG